MEYSKIIAVTGLPGLHELVSSKTDGAIVRSLDDKSTRFVSSRIHNFSHLESIEIFTTRENVNLVEIFKAMDSGGESLPDDKDATAVKRYFEKVFPDLDFDRVYNSDMKKMIKWFSTLKGNNIELKLSEPAEEEEAVETVEVVEAGPEVVAKPKAVEKTPSKKATTQKAEPEPKKPAAKAKKTAAPANKEKATDKKTEAPPKKKAASKAKEEDKSEPTKKASPRKK